MCSLLPSCIHLFSQSLIQSVTRPCIHYFIHSHSFTFTLPVHNLASHPSPTMHLCTEHLHEPFIHIIVCLSIYFCLARARLCVLSVCLFACPCLSYERSKFEPRITNLALSFMQTMDVAPRRVS